MFSRRLGQGNRQATAQWIFRMTSARCSTTDLSAQIALTAAQMAPEYATAMVIEDPPGLSGIDLGPAADPMAATVQETRADS